MIRTAGLLSAAAIAAFLIPPGMAAQSTSNPNMNDNTSQSATANAGMSEAARMVPARAALDRTLDAKKAQPGQSFQVKLANTVQLKDGQELPRGTTLMGKVGTDDMHETGRSKLVLCINEAKLKNGKTIPVKATIVGIYGPNQGDADTAGYTVNAGDQEPNNWSHQVTQVDQLGALSGVDLHSKITSRNSGVLVSTKKNDIKIDNGTELALAIAAENQGQSRNQNNGRTGSGS